VRLIFVSFISGVRGLFGRGALPCDARSASTARSRSSQQAARDFATISLSYRSLFAEALRWVLSV
jgi:hypothetical protein